MYLSEPQHPVQPRFYAYTVVDISQTPPEPVAIEMSRKLARQRVDAADESIRHSLRIRRTQCKLFER